jgi:hypothetical protein
MLKPPKAGTRRNLAVHKQFEVFLHHFDKLIDKRKPKSVHKRARVVVVGSKAS